jgi:hypothetical protein
VKLGAPRDADAERAALDSFRAGLARASRELNPIGTEATTGGGNDNAR